MQLAARFNRKAGMRETWLSENQRLVSQDNFGSDLASVEAALKKHEVGIFSSIFSISYIVVALNCVGKLGLFYEMKVMKIENFDIRLLLNYNL